MLSRKNISLSVFIQHFISWVRIEAEMVGYKEGGLFLGEFCLRGRMMETNNDATIEPVTQRYRERDLEHLHGLLV